LLIGGTVDLCQGRHFYRGGRRNGSKNVRSGHLSRYVRTDSNRREAVRSSRRQFGKLGCGALILAVGGCGGDEFLSQNGPSRVGVINRAQLRVQPMPGDRELRYVLVPLTEKSLDLLSSDEILPHFPSAPTALRTADGLIGIGDEISITVFESGSGGLFLPREGGTRAGNFVTVPTQQVSKSGTIEMPYAGTIRVDGSSPGEVSAAIQRRLSNRALEPQVVVSVIDRRATPVSVLGEVTSSTRFSLDPGGVRILEAIARAGGPKFPSWESEVTLQRNGSTYSALLSEIAQNGRQNVQLQANDVIYVSHKPRYYLAMGAIGPSSSIGPVDRRVTFNDDHITLIDALGRAGGLLDDRASAASVFIYRMVPRITVGALGIGDVTSLPNPVPTVFLCDLRDPAGFFHASRFAVHHEDVLYISNAPSVDLTKFLNIVVPVTGSAASIRAVVQ